MRAKMFASSAAFAEALSTRARVQAQAKKASLTLTDLEIMSYLNEQPKSSASAIAAELELTKPATSTSLRHLAERGYTVDIVDHSDLRLCRTRLSTAGEMAFYALVSQLGSQTVSYALFVQRTIRALESAQCNLQTSTLSLTGITFLVYADLAKREGVSTLTANEFAKAATFSQPRVAAAIKQLVEAGFVSATTTTGDHRSKRLTLTARATRFVRKLAHKIGE